MTIVHKIVMGGKAEWERLGLSAGSGMHSPVMGIPENPDARFSSSKSFSVFSGLMHTGSRMKPCLYFYTRIPA